MKVQLVLDLTYPFFLGFRVSSGQSSSFALQAHLYLLYWQVAPHWGQLCLALCGRHKKSRIFMAEAIPRRGLRAEFQKHHVPKERPNFSEGWTTSTPAVTDGWVFQKILLLKLAGDSLFSCFWQELGFSVKHNNSAKWLVQDFLSSILFLCGSFNCLGQANSHSSNTLIYTHCAGEPLDRHFPESDPRFWPLSGSQAVPKLWLNTRVLCVMWWTECAASRQVFLAFLLGFIERG